MNEETHHRSYPELHLDTRLIVERLERVGVGEMVTYEELSGILGRDIRGSVSRSHLYSAMKRLVRERIVFETVRKVGVKRLEPEAVLEIPKAALASIGRKARKAARKLVTVDYEGLDRAQKVKHDTAASLLAVVAHMARPKTAKMIQGKVESSSAPLAIAKTIEALQKEE